METDKPNPYENKSTFIEYLDEETGGLLEHLTVNLQHYMLKARKGLRERLEAEPKADTKAFTDKVLAEKFSHSDHINQRLDFAKYVASFSSVKLTKKHLAIMWDELVALQMFAQDADLFFGFLKELCNMYSQGYALLDLDDLLGFFRESILNESDGSVLTKLGLEGFYCIQSFFLLANEQERKLCRLNVEATTSTYPEKKFTSYSSNAGASH